GPRARLDDVRRRRPDPGGSAAVRHGAGQGPRVDGRKRPSGGEREPDRRPERGRPEPPAAGEPMDPVRSDRTGFGPRPSPALQPLLPTRPRAGVPGASRDPAEEGDRGGPLPRSVDGRDRGGGRLLGREATRSPAGAP